MIQIQRWIAVAMVIVAVVIGAGVTWWIADTQADRRIAIKDTELANLKAQHAVNLQAISDQAEKDTASAINRMKAAQEALAQLDNEHSQELAHAQAENDALKRDVADGTRRVRILQANLATANIAAGQHATSGSASAGSVGNAAEIELTAAAGRNILDIRSGIINDQAKLDYLQGYIRDVVKQCRR